MLIILDRDGVINQDSIHYIKSPDEWIALPGSLAAIAQLNQRGHQVVVATNQSGVGRGYYSLATLDAMHAKMRAELSAVGGHIDGIYFCPHTPTEDCACRKPRPGMLQAIGQDFQADLTQAILVGDTLRDLQAAQAVGAQCALVLTGKGQQTQATGEGLSGIPVYADLAAFVATGCPLS